IVGASICKSRLMLPFLLVDGGRDFMVILHLFAISLKSIRYKGNGMFIVVQYISFDSQEKIADSWSLA
ncbi:MAG TPA: hypothetical protein VGN34_14460, partial [Ktedonobacteraceae bacterium]